VLGDEAEGSEPRKGMLLRIIMPNESDMPDGIAGDICDDADDDGNSERVVRGAVESAWLRVLPERDDDDLSRILVRDGSTAAETREDCNDGSVIVVRHERRWDTRVDDRVDERDACELQSGKSDDTSECVVWTDIDVRIPGDVLRRACVGSVDDDVHVRGQQRVRTVHEDIDVLVAVGDKGAGGDIGDAVERAVRKVAGRADNGSVLHVHAVRTSGTGWNTDEHNGDGDVSICGRRSEPGEQDQCAGLHDHKCEPAGCALQLW